MLLLTQNQKNKNFVELLQNNKSDVFELLNDEEYLLPLLNKFMEHYRDQFKALQKEIDEDMINYFMSRNEPWYKILNIDAVKLNERIIYNTAFINQLRQSNDNRTEEELILDFLNYFNINKLEQLKKLKRQEIQNSDEPWVEILGGNVEGDDSGYIEIKLDWNPAFIKYLNDNGIRDKTPELTVQKWISTLNANTMANNLGFN